MRSSGTLASRDHFFHCLFLSPDFHELWHSVLSICLITEVGCISTGMEDRLGVLLLSLMALRLTLVNQNPFHPCFWTMTFCIIFGLLSDSILESVLMKIKCCKSIIRIRFVMGRRCANTGTR